MDKNEVRERAMAVAEKHERKRGTFGRRVEYDKSVPGIDILSSDRRIEVKGRTGEDHFVQMNYKNVEACMENDNFWLYIVHFDEKENATLIQLARDEVLRRCKKHECWEIPFWKKDFGVI